MNAQIPTLFVCHGDDGGPRFQPCRWVQEALRAAGIQYEKVIAAHGSPIPFLRKGSRDELRAATGTEKLPTLKLPDGTVMSHSHDILAWVDRQTQTRFPETRATDDSSKTGTSLPRAGYPSKARRNR